MTSYRPGTCPRSPAGDPRSKPRWIDDQRGVAGARLDGPRQSAIRWPHRPGPRYLRNRIVGSKGFIHIETVRLAWHGDLHCCQTLARRLSEILSVLKKSWVSKPLQQRLLVWSAAPSLDRLRYSTSTGMKDGKLQHMPIPGAKPGSSIASVNKSIHQLSEISCWCTLRIMLV